MAQTTRKIRFVTGLESKYTANKAKYANDVYICEDKPVIYVRGVSIIGTDTVYTHPSYTARTGQPTANQTPSFGSTFNISQVVSDSKGHITAANTRTVKIPNTVATETASGLMSADDKTKLNLTTTRSCYLHVSTLSGLQSGSTFNGYGFYTSASNMVHALIDAMKLGQKITFVNVTKTQLDDYLDRPNQQDGAGFYLMDAAFCMYESQTATTGRIFMQRTAYNNPRSHIKIEFSKSSSSVTFTNIKVTITTES